jgi:transposase
LSHEKRLCTSDVTNEQWQVIKPLLPLEQEGPGHPIELDMRQTVNAIFYIVGSWPITACGPFRGKGATSVFRF